VPSSELAFAHARLIARGGTAARAGVAGLGELASFQTWTAHVGAFGPTPVFKLLRVAEASHAYASAQLNALHQLRRCKL
jgi:hypothetical protein